LEVNDVEVRILGGPQLKNHTFFPKYLSITVRGGADQIAEFSNETINAYLFYNQIISDSTGILIPEITAPKNITILKISPSFRISL